MKKILIAKDVEMNRDLLVQLLEDNYELVEAADGRQGLASIRAESPDLALLDISLPEMDGYEVTRAVRADEVGQRTRDRHLRHPEREVRAAVLPLRPVRQLQRLAVLLARRRVRHR